MPKYIITPESEIIVFPETMLHSHFEDFKPLRAGFISFGVDSDGNPSCSCYGESYSLGLRSDPEKDTKIAKQRLILVIS
jgi:hypothetical protein